MNEKLDYVRSRGQQVHGKKYDYVELRRLPNGTLQVLLKCPDPAHEAFWQATNNHYSGKGCTQCNRAGKPAQHDLESVKAKFEAVSNDRYDYLAIDRTGKTPMLRLACKTHGEFTQNLYNHLSGKGCRLCKQGQTNKVSDSELSNKAIEKGLTYLGSYQKYKSKNRIVKLSCPTHGEYDQQMTPFLKGAECPACAAITAGRSRLNSIEELQAYLPKGVKVHDQDYENNRVLLECEKHGAVLGNRASLFSNVGCVSCSFGASKEADEMYLELLRFKLNLQKEYVIPGTKFRLDFYFPEKQVAVEYHGLYWHTEEKVGRSYHKLKHDLAEKAGIRVIHIFSDEWKTRKKAVLSLIQNSLGVAKESVQARKLTVKSVVEPEASDFFENHHIQGKTTSSKYVGLYSEDTLLACLAYSNRKLSAANETVCEVTRYASATRVVGGFGKLLKFVTRQELQFSKFVAFSDIRVFTGKLYQTLGFAKTKQLSPDYTYVVNGKRVHKSHFTVAKFQELAHLKFSEGLTEAQLAELNKLSRVYDCGRVRWELVV